MGRSLPGGLFNRPSCSVEEVFGKGLLADKNGLWRGRTKDSVVVRVLGREALQVTRVVGLKLALHWVNWIHSASM